MVIYLDQWRLTHVEEHNYQIKKSNNTEKIDFIYIVMVLGL
jgi:hypothetical protein